MIDGIVWGEDPDEEANSLWPDDMVYRGDK